MLMPLLVWVAITTPEVDVRTSPELEQALLNAGDPTEAPQLDLVVADRTLRAKLGTVRRIHRQTASTPSHLPASALSWKADSTWDHDPTEPLLSAEPGLSWQDRDLAGQRLALTNEHRQEASASSATAASADASTESSDST